MVASLLCGGVWVRSVYPAVGRVGNEHGLRPEPALVVDDGGDRVRPLLDLGAELGLGPEVWRLARLDDRVEDHGPVRPEVDGGDLPVAEANDRTSVGRRPGEVELELTSVEGPGRAVDAKHDALRHLDAGELGRALGSVDAHEHLLK